MKNKIGFLLSTLLLALMKSSFAQADACICTFTQYTDVSSHSCAYDYESAPRTNFKDTTLECNDKVVKSNLTYNQAVALLPTDVRIVGTSTIPFQDVCNNASRVITTFSSSESCK